MKPARLKLVSASVAVIVSLTAFLALRSVGAQDVYDIKAHYTKSEHMIQMRDGIKLFTVVYAPKDASQTYPILLSRTPYSCSPYGPDNYKEFVGPSPLFTREGYIVAYQDVRGAFMSEGEYVNMRPQLS